MPLDKLIDRIMNDARERAGGITAESRRRSEQILADADAGAGELYHRKVDEARRAAEAEKKHRLTLAALEARRGILEEKQGFIQEVFDRAVQAVTSLPAQQYLELMVRLLVRSAGGDGEEVILSPEDRERIGEEAVARANGELDKTGTGKSGRLVLSRETRHMAGGFILRTEGIETNNSLEAVIGSRRDELEMRIVEILFPESG